MCLSHYSFILFHQLITHVEFHSLFLDLLEYLLLSLLIIKTTKLPHHLILEVFSPGFGDLFGWASCLARCNKLRIKWIETTLSCDWDQGVLLLLLTLFNEQRIGYISRERQMRVIEVRRSIVWWGLVLIRDQFSRWFIVIVKGSREKAKILHFLAVFMCISIFSRLQRFNKILSCRIGRVRP